MYELSISAIIDDACHVGANWIQNFLTTKLDIKSFFPKHVCDCAGHYLIYCLDALNSAIIHA